MKKGSIIYEKYGFAFTRWNADKFADTAKEILTKSWDVDEIVDNFNDQLVPKKWFKWDDVFTELEEEQIVIEGAGVKNGCKATVTYKTELTGEDYEKLIFGDSEDEKFGGLMFNPSLKRVLRKAGVSSSGGSRRW